MNHTLIVLSLGLAGACAPPLLAQESRVTLDQALSLFATDNLDLRMARARAAEAAGLATQAAAFPNPEITATHEPLSGAARTSSESYLNLSQRLELPGKRGARSEAGARMRDAALARLRADSVRLAFDVKRAYVQAAFGGDLVAVTERVATVFREASAAAAARFEEGDVSRYDVRRIAVERARYENLTAEAALDAVEGQRALAQLVSPEGNSRALATDPLPQSLPPEVPARLLVAASAVLRAELAAARADVDAAGAQLRLVRAERLPDVTATGGYKRQSDGLDGTFFGLSVPLPLFDRNRGAVEAGDARLRGAQERLALTRRQLDDDLRRAADAYASLRVRAELLIGAAIGEADDLLGVARMAYDAGEMELVELLDAAEALHQARTAEARLRADLWIAYYDLERALGGFPIGDTAAPLENAR